MNELIKNLAEEFEDAEFAHSYMQSHAVSRIAAQIFALRKQRGWSQEELAERAGIAQERVSKIESADFTSLTMKTLHKFAMAFDIDVRIAFESFSEGILDVAKLSPEKLEVQPRAEDLATLRKHLSPPIVVWQQAASVSPEVVTLSVPPAPHRNAIVGAWNSIRVSGS